LANKKVETSYKGSLSAPSISRKPVISRPKPTPKPPLKPKPPIIIGPDKVVKKEVEKPPAENPQVAAVMTYRRKFVDNSRKFSVEAYAIGLQSGRVLLRQVGVAKEMALPIDRLCDEDRQWLNKNENKIRSNGEKVRRFVLANGL